MTLRNAFDGMGEEGTLRSILRAVGFAKDAADRLRVVVDNTVPVSGTVTSTINAANQAGVIGATVIAPYSQNSWNNHDAREQYQVMSQQSMMSERARWSIT